MAFDRPTKIQTIANAMTNPYSPPMYHSTLEHDPKSDVRARAARPATALIIMSSVHSVFVVIYLVSVISFRDLSLAQNAISLGIGCLQLAALLLIAIGGAKMGFLESLAMARLGAILACIPFATPFIILGLPFGIWSLRLLSDPIVQASFPSTRIS